MVEIDPDVLVVLRCVPEFAACYLDLVEDGDGDPGAPAAFSELAGFAAGLAADIGAHVQVLHRLLGAVEEIAASSPDARARIGWAFLDSLSPEETASLSPWLGPCTRALADGLEQGPGDGRATG
jgi:hypothetical protein